MVHEPAFHGINHPACSECDSGGLQIKQVAACRVAMAPLQPVRSASADDAELDAADAIDFAAYTIDEAEYAVVDAVIARADANDIALQQS